VGDTEDQKRIRFYQTGTLTVGNRLLDEENRTVQATLERANAITSGHRACQGCGEALGARYAEGGGKGSGLTLDSHKVGLGWPDR